MTFLCISNCGELSPPVLKLEGTMAIPPPPLWRRPCRIAKTVAILAGPVSCVVCSRSLKGNQQNCCGRSYKKDLQERREKLKKSLNAKFRGCRDAYLNRIFKQIRKQVGIILWGWDGLETRHGSSSMTLRQRDRAFNGKRWDMPDQRLSWSVETRGAE